MAVEQWEKRPTKNARGLTKTAHRSGHRMNPAALGISVRGTTDRLSASWLYRKPVPKPVTYQLTDYGKRRLNLLRRLRSRRANA